MLNRVPVADGSTWTVKSKATPELTGRSTVVARAPLPLVGPETLPPPVLAMASQVAPVAPNGSGSVTLAPMTSSGPKLKTLMVYVVLVPGTTVSLPSLTKTSSSAAGIA
jgi:hypothetical protein